MIQSQLTRTMHGKSESSTIFLRVISNIQLLLSIYLGIICDVWQFVDPFGWWHQSLIWPICSEQPFLILHRKTTKPSYSWINVHEVWWSVRNSASDALMVQHRHITFHRHLHKVNFVWSPKPNDSFNWISSRRLHRIVFRLSLQIILFCRSMRFVDIQKTAHFCLQ